MIVRLTSQSELSSFFEELIVTLAQHLGLNRDATAIALNWHRLLGYYSIDCSYCCGSDGSRRASVTADACPASSAEMPGSRVHDDGDRKTRLQAAVHSNY